MERLAEFRFPKRRSEWLLGRRAAKSLAKSLPDYQHYRLDEMEILNDPSGAPRIHFVGGGILPGCLSISHCDDLAACALSSDLYLKIGIDLEKIETRPDNFIEDYFTPGERKLARSRPEETEGMVSTLIWSAKEAVLKALGVGLRWDTRQVEIGGFAFPAGPSGDWQAVQAVTPREHHPWQVCWQRRGGYILTLAGFSSEASDFSIIERKP